MRDKDNKQPPKTRLEPERSPAAGESVTAEPQHGAAWDEELLQSYFDGEVGENEAAALQLDVTQPEIRRSLAQLEFIQQGLRDLIGEERRLSQAAAGGVPLWDRIEHQLDAYEPQPLGELESWGSSAWIQRVSRQLSSLVEAGRFGSWGLAAVCASLGLVFVSKGMFQSDPGASLSVASSASQDASRSGSHTVAMVSGTYSGGTYSGEHNAGNQSQIPVVSMTGSSTMLRRPGEHNFSSPVAGGRQQRAPFLSSVPLAVDTRQLIGENPIPGGLRTDGLDIEWIKTERPFRILPSNSRKAPPVIWVARGGSGGMSTGGQQ